MPGREALRAANEFEAFQLLRLIECAYPGKARLGTAARPEQEPIRLGQDPELRFSTAQVTSYEPARETAFARLAIDFGLLGPQGPMPLHVTEYVRARARHMNDRTLERFLDVFHHRLASLFYRAWAASQPVIGLDRPGEDRFAAYIESLCGLRCAVDGPDAIGDEEKLGAAAWLGERRRHASGLAALLVYATGVPIVIEPFVGQWSTLPEEVHWRLGGRDRGALAQGYVLGRRVWDRQHRFRIVAGPLNASECEGLLPGTEGMRRVRAWVRQYVGTTLDFDVELRLSHDAAQPMRLGRSARLARCAWLGGTRASAVEPALRFRAEAATMSTTEQG